MREALRTAPTQHSTELRTAVDVRLAALQAGNEATLDEMRKTADEKLHAPLEAGLGESFKQVSKRLEQVHRGLGEMATLATGVGDLKRVLTHVKTRGGWGAVQLESLLEQTLTTEQFSRSVMTRPGLADTLRRDYRITIAGPTTLTALLNSLQMGLGSKVCA